MVYINGDTLPIAWIGGVIGLIVAHGTLGFMTILGFLSLAGIIINNAIVLLDRIQIELDKGAESHNAVITAAALRFRPILMTTLTTMLGLMPLVFFGGALWYSMAITIVFGLGIGTIVTLGVIPIIYCWFYRITVPRVYTLNA